MENKRLFFGFDVACPWPERLPPGRLLAEPDRHLTLAFLGSGDEEKLSADLSVFSGLPFSIGLSAIFDHPLFLPRKSPRVAAWRIHWLEGGELFSRFQHGFVDWLRERGWEPKGVRDEFLPHVTIARKPFGILQWKEAFRKQPLFIRDFCLYESLGGLRYRACWRCPVLAPFDEIEHTADIAFIVRGTSIQNLFLHAQTALSFHFPQLLDYFSFGEVGSLEGIVEALNRMIGKADAEIGSPFKAVSYHGNLKGMEILEWEMIVDV